jgi:hypothetical protein
MDALRMTTRIPDHEREHLARAHHEICTALTVFCSNVELVRIELRNATLPENGAPIRAHLDELESAVDRLRQMADEMKRWHADAAPAASGASAPSEPTTRSVRPSA